MNRIIKFRGKRMDNGEWVYGDLIQADNGEDVSILPIEQKDVTEHVLVIPETVGQYTGLKDKEGTEVYEGDVMQFISTECHDYMPEFDHENLKDTPINAVMRWSESAYGFRLNIQSRFKVIDSLLKVVGNIHNNPELLKQP